MLVHPEFRRGALEMASPVLGMAAWGLVTGVAMVKSGLTVAQALGMSLFVFAGSAQLASLPLIAAGAPLWVILVTAFCVNLRFVIFSAAWRPYFGHLSRLRRLRRLYIAGDVTYVNFMRRFPDPQPGEGQREYFWGALCVNWLGWQGASVIGILAADRVPTQWGLGFAGVLALIGLAWSLAMVSPQVRAAPSPSPEGSKKSWGGPAVSFDRALLIVMAVAAAVSVATYHLPLRLHIVCAIGVAGAVGWWLDRKRIGGHV